MKKCIIITIFILLLLIPSIVNADTASSGTFKYMPAFLDETEEVYYYSDDCFRQSSKIDFEIDNTNSAKKIIKSMSSNFLRKSD